VEHYKAYKVRLYPNKKQELDLMQFFGNCRFVYNQMLEMQSTRYKNGGKYVSTFSMNYMLKEMKQEYPFLKLSPSQSLQQACANLNSAFQNFFKKQAKYPRFHSRKGKQAIHLLQACAINHGKLKLPKLGTVRFRGAFLKGDLVIKQVTVSYTPSHKFYASILVKCEKQALPKANKQVGLDMGVADLAILSTGTKVPTRKYSKLERKLLIWQRKLARRRGLAKQEIAKAKHYEDRELTLDDFSNYNKAKIMVAKLYEKIANSRKDYLHKVTTSLVREYDLIAMEDLKTKNMVKNHSLAKSISNQGWGMFRTMLQYKCEWYGKQLVTVNPRNTSRVCSNCGADTGKKPLDIRDWICPECGAHHDRDVNAAKNILKLAI
jgi:putative transposase